MKRMFHNVYELNYLTTNEKISHNLIKIYFSHNFTYLNQVLCEVCYVEKVNVSTKNMKFPPFRRFSVG